MHAVAEAARKVACTGATPVAATNCLNFGNPEKPEIMAQLSAAIDGIAEACTALGTPVTGGNVSLYNETKGEGIYPTPVLGVVGILDDVTKAVPSSFQNVGDTVMQLCPTRTYRAFGPDHTELVKEIYSALGSSEYAKVCLNSLWGQPSTFDLESEAALHRLLAKLGKGGLIKSACDVSDGGWAVACAKAGFEKSIGLDSDWSVGYPEPGDYFEPFIEHASMAIVSCSKQDVTKVIALAQREGLNAHPLGTTTSGAFEYSADGGIEIRTTIEELRCVFSSALESQLEAEVLA
jgi:phosphoribosylformylglycinamidine synthase